MPRSPKVLARVLVKAEPLAQALDLPNQTRGANIEQCVAMLLANSTVKLGASSAEEAEAVAEAAGKSGIC